MSLLVTMDNITDSGVALIGGIAIGDEGEQGTIFEGYKLAAGDDFDTTPTRWHGKNLSGKYAHSAIAYGFRGNGSNDRHMYVDPEFRGARSTSEDALGIDRVSVASSIATLTVSAPEAEIVPFLPTTYTDGRGDAENKPRLLSGSLKTAPHFMFSAQGDWIIEALIRLPSGDARGFQPAFWSSSFFWPDYGEIDLMEAEKASGGAITNHNTIHHSLVDGGANTPENVDTQGITADIYVWYVARRSGTTITFYDDAGTGTLVLRGSTSANTDRIRGAHDIRLDFGVNTTWDSSTFNIADWPKSIDFDWWRAWVPSDAGDNAVTTMLPPVLTTPGGAWTATFPAKVDLFGSGAGLEQVSGAFDNFDSPGMIDRDTLTEMSGSMTVDLVARTVAGTVPSTEGGFSGVYLTYAYDDGSPVRRVLLPYYVAPAAQASLFSNQNFGYTDVVDLDIIYTDFHSGSLGPHTYTVTADDDGWLTITGNGTGAVNISGDVPDEDLVITLDIECTNSVDQTTTVQRTLTIAEVAAFNPATWAEAIEWWDASDASTVFSDFAATTPAVVDTDTVMAFEGKKLGAILGNSVADATRPTYITDALHSMKAVKFTAASNQKLFTDDATVAAAASGDDKAYSVLMALRRGTAGVSVSPSSFGRTAGTTNDFLRHFISAANAVGVTKGVNGTPTNGLSGSGVAASDVWDVILWHHTGTTLNVRVNGVLVANAVALNTAAVTINRFVLGMVYNNSTDVFDTATPFGGAVGEVMVIDGAVAIGDATLAEAEAYLIDKWIPA
jgi:hypothetical protein